MEDDSIEIPIESIKPIPEVPGVYRIEPNEAFKEWVKRQREIVIE